MKFKPPSKYHFPILLCVLTLLGIMAIEIGHPYFFLQDDNRGQFLPDMVHNLRAVASGEFPLFNFHQHLGTPVSIQYAAYYPLSYIALCLSKIFLGTYFGTMEFLAAIHLLIAVLGYFYFLRSFGLADEGCCFGAIAWTFCGFVIAVGNSWFHIVGYAAYLPWILLFSIKQSYKQECGYFSMLVVVRVLALLLGYPQFFAYVVLFDFMTNLAVYLGIWNNTGAVFNEDAKQSTFSDSSHPQPWIKILCYQALNYLCVFIIALPMLFQTFHQVTVSFDRQQALSWDTYAAYSYDLKQWFNGLIAPFGDIEYIRMGEQHFISHIGYVTLVFLVVAMICIRDTVKIRLVLIFMGLGLFALLWASDTVITETFFHIPVYNRFRWPFKLAFFTSFYFIAASAFGFDVFYNKLRSTTWRGRNIATGSFLALIALHASNFIVLHAMLPQHMLSEHLDKVPFYEPLKGKLTNGRIVSVGLDVVHQGDKALWGFSAPSLGFNYATLWNLYHFGGNDALVPEKNFKATLGCNWRSDFNLAPGSELNIPQDTPLEYFRKWGVRWWVVDSRIPLRDIGNLELVYKDPLRNVLRDPASMPYAFWSDSRGGKGIKVHFATNSLRTTTNAGTDGLLVINVLYNPFFVATMDGNKIPITETNDGQVSLAVPGGQHSIAIQYVDNHFFYGSVVSITFLIVLGLTCGLIFVIKKYRYSKQ